MLATSIASRSLNSIYDSSPNRALPVTAIVVTRCDPQICRANRATTPPIPNPQHSNNHQTCPSPRMNPSRLVQRTRDFEGIARTIRSIQEGEKLRANLRIDTSGARRRGIRLEQMRRIEETLGSGSRVSTASSASASAPSQASDPHTWVGKFWRHSGAGWGRTRWTRRLEAEETGSLESWAFIGPSGLISVRPSGCFSWEFKSIMTP